MTTNRYRVGGRNGWYGAYDLQDKVFVGTLFPAYDNPQEPHTNAAPDGYKKAQAFCDELNRKEIHNVFQKIIATETERLKDWEWDDELREWKPKSSC